MRKARRLGARGDWPVRYVIRPATDSVAWISAAVDRHGGIGEGVFAYERGVDGRGIRRLDRRTGQVSTLRLRGNRVWWRDAGQLRSATLR